MSVPVPVGLKYSATSAGQRWKPVRCQHCKLEWAYLVTRKGGGQGVAILGVGADDARVRAEEQAQAELIKKLDGAVEPVRCPQCRQFQASMVEELEDQRAAPFLLATIAAVVGSLVLAYNERLAEAGAVLVLGGGAWVGGRIRRSRFDVSQLKEDAGEPLPTLLRAEWDAARAAGEQVPKVWWQDLDAG